MTEAAFGTLINESFSYMHRAIAECNRVLP